MEGLGPSTEPTTLMPTVLAGPVPPLLPLFPPLRHICGLLLLLFPDVELPGSIFPGSNFIPELLAVMALDGVFGSLFTLLVPGVAPPPPPESILKGSCGSCFTKESEGPTPPPPPEEEFVAGEAIPFPPPGVEGVPTEAPGVEGCCCCTAEEDGVDGAWNWDEGVEGVAGCC